MTPRTALSVDAHEPREPTLPGACPARDRARADAELLNQQLSDAQTRRVQIEAAIADAERKIPALRARVAELEEAAKERAVELYVGHVDRLETMFDSANVVEGARAAQLAGIVAADATDLAATLRDAARKLEIRETELAVGKRDALRATIASLGPLQEQLQDRLRAASAAYSSQVVQAWDQLGRSRTVDARE